MLYWQAGKKYDLFDLLHLELLLHKAYFDGHWLWIVVTTQVMGRGV
mgnify:CR=1 FL=1